MAAHAREHRAAPLTRELAAECEPRLSLPPPPADFPVGVALRCPAALIYDHARDVTLLVAEPDRPDLIDRLAADLASAQRPIAPAQIRVDAIEEAPQRF